MTTLIIFFSVNLLILSNNQLVGKDVDPLHKCDNPLSLTPADEKVDWHDYALIRKERARKGPGEHGEPIFLSSKEKSKPRNRQLYLRHGYDAVVSDMIAWDRALKDLRTPRCRDVKYRRDLPSVSIIIPYYEEHLSALVRTFVSAYIRAPPHLIKEVILADDNSQDPLLHDPLDKIVAKYPKVRVLRMKTRMGAIRVRQAGARNATGDVLIFLDSHTEAGVNWLPPLLEPIVDNYRMVTCPFIDVLHLDTFGLTPYDEGARGTFSWYMNYRRLPVPNRGPHNQEEPFESPIMAGGLFAITRKWFWEFGGYDTQLDVWGGEQYDLSFKIWMCGGRMIDIPCSRFGHIFRINKPFLQPGSSIDFIYRNYKRIIETWFDEYKKIAYKFTEPIKLAKAGNVDAAKSLRKRLKCKPFDWFIKKVAPDIIEWFPLVQKDVAFGQLHCKRFPKLCLDFGPGDDTRPNKIIFTPCVDENKLQGSTQDLLLTWRGEITLLPDKKRCLTATDGMSQVEKCNSHYNGLHHWKYETTTEVTNNLLLHRMPYIKCGECYGEESDVKFRLSHCRLSNDGQQWFWSHVDKKAALDLVRSL